VLAAFVDVSAFLSVCAWNETKVMIRDVLNENKLCKFIKTASNANDYLCASSPKCHCDAK